MASVDAESTKTLIVNHSLQESCDLSVEVKFTGLKQGIKTLTVYRVDDKHHWSREDLELIPVERREIDTIADRYSCHVYCPAESVVLVVLEDKAAAAREQRTFII